MSEQKWTKGPWFADPENGDVVSAHARPRTIAEAFDAEGKALCGNEDAALANAHLIAASPDLYAALEAVVSSAWPSAVAHPAMFKAWAVALDALRKARGEQ